MKRNMKIYENPILYLLILIVGIGTVMMYSASSIIAINTHNEYLLDQLQKSAMVIRSID